MRNFIYYFFLFFLIISCNVKKDEYLYQCPINSCFKNFELKSYLRSTCLENSEGHESHLKIIDIIDSTSQNIIEIGGGYNENYSLVKGCHTNSELVSVMNILSVEIEKNFYDSLDIQYDEANNNFKNVIDNFFFSNEKIFNEEYLLNTNISTVYNDLILCEYYLILILCDLEHT